MEKKLFGVLNAVDIILIAIIIIAVVGGVYRFVFMPRTEKNEEISVKMQMLSSNTPDYAADKIKEGDVCVNNENGAKIGVISDVEFFENRLLVRIDCSASKAENGFIIEDVLYLIAQDLKIRVGDVLISANIIEIEP